MNYINMPVAANDGLSVALGHKSMETKSKCYQLVGSLCEATDLLEVELKNEQPTINNLRDIQKISDKQKCKRWKSWTSSNKSK